MKHNQYLEKEIANDFIVIIRSAGERTKDACLHIVRQQLPEENIFVIEEKPFEAAIRKCYEIGIESGKKWMITIDADILPHKCMIKNLFDQSQIMSDNIIMFNGVLYDHLLLKYRKGGIKVYRVKHLRKAIHNIPPDGTQIRPEAFVLKKMTENGLKKKYTNIVTGIHDFEQYYADIYRKCFVHTQKNTDFISLLKKWKHLSINHPDYQVALAGGLDGLLSSEFAKADIRAYQEKSSQALIRLGLEEKQTFNINSANQIVDQTLSAAGSFVGHQNFFGNYLAKTKQHGVLYGLRYSVGSLVEKFGNKLKPTP